MASLLNIGRPAGHVEGPEKVTGRAKYSADINLPGMLWGKCVRSPFPHARIVSIDTTRARVLLGVHAVITAADIPDVLIGRNIVDMPVLARDVVRFTGEKVIAVAAESADIAEEAVALIDIGYEELPAVFDPIEAMEEGAPRVHADTSRYKYAPIPPFFHGDNQILPPIPNVASRVLESHGDVQAGFAEADRIFEHTFYTPNVHQGFIEPHACVIDIPSDGSVDVWTSNKGPFAARSQFAEAVGLSAEQVRLNAAAIGGDFGGKGDLMDSVVAYHLAKSSGRPVKMVMTYAEELTAGNPRHAALITIRSGVTNDGRPTARQAKIIFNSGAYAAFKPLHTIHGSVHAGGPYRVDNVEIECLVVYTNNVPCGHMRSPGGPQVVFALESHLDIIAHELGIDPLEFRLRNALQEGDVAPLGERYHNILCRETLQAAADAAGWGSDKEPWVGRGIAMYERPAGGGSSSATLTVDANGRFSMLAAIPDTGTGSYTILQQIVAEELQVPLESISVHHGGTAIMPPDWGVGASRVSHTAGKAAAMVAREVREALVQAAARELNCQPEQVRWQNGNFVADTGASISLAELLKQAERIGELPITRSATYTSPGNYEEEITSYTAQIAEVEVDPETGQVKLRKIYSAHDAGTVLNPLTHQGQIDGGVVQGLGQALIEHLQIEDGVVSTAHLGDYKLPSITDIPELETVLIETPSGPTPYGGKAIGELSNVAVPAAIANAVYDATGVRFMELPITADKVYEALQASDNAS